jgi:hypothetical protein
MSIPKSSQKRLLRLISARADMEYASEAFRLFQAACGTPAGYHIFLSMVVCYCRPFTQSRGIGSILCEYPEYPDYADEEMNMRHQRMMDIRHNFSSHSSIQGTRAFLLAPQARHPATGEIFADFYYAVAKRAFEHPEFAPWLHELVERFAERLDADIRVVAKEIGSNYLGEGDTYELDTGADDFAWTPPKVT